MNVFAGQVQDGTVQALGARWPIPAGLATTPGQAVHYGIRPSDLQLADQGIAAKVIVIEPTGAETELLVEVGAQQITLVMHGRTQARPDDVVYLQVDTDKAHVFDTVGGKRL
jgi:multiple sugar transport system ATP-binding protein